MIEQQSVDSEGLRFDSLWELTFSSLTHTCDKTKNIFLHFFTKLKTYRLFYYSSIYKLDTIDIADPSSMLEACHMNFVIDLAHHRVSVAQWYRNGAQNLKVWGSIPHGYSGFFSFSHTHDKTKNIFLYFFNKLKTYHLSYHSIYSPNSCQVPYSESYAELAQEQYGQ